MDKLIGETNFFSNISNERVFLTRKYTEWDKTYNFNKKLEETLPCITQKYVKITEDIALFSSYKLGSGAFGKVYYGFDVRRRKELAIKIQSTKTLNDLLAKENYFLNQLKEAPGFPTVHFYGEWKGHKIMVQDLLGPSLDKIFKFCKKKLRQQTVFKLGLNMVDLLETIHRNNILHRDIKPNNFVYGTYDSKFLNYIPKIHLIDFGLSCLIHESNGQHCVWNNKSSFVGTPRYASINTHYGIRQSRRDDLESLFYVLIYLAKGSLPWQGVKAKTKEERKDMIKSIKKKISSSELCRDLPGIFVRLIDNIKQLQYDEKPNYDDFRSILKISNQMNEEDDLNLWEWEEIINTQSNKEAIKEDIKELFEGYPFDLNNYLSFLDIKKTLHSFRIQSRRDNQ